MSTGDVESAHPQSPTDDAPEEPSSPAALSPKDLLSDDEEDDVTTEYHRPEWIDDGITQVNIDRPLLPSPPAVPDFGPKKR